MTLQHSDRVDNFVSDYPDHLFQERQRGPMSNEDTISASKRAYARAYGLPTAGWKQPVRDRVALHDADSVNSVSNDSGTTDSAPLDRAAAYERNPTTSTVVRQSLSSMSASSAGSRPMSIRNIAEATSSMRPSRFVKPATQTTHTAPVSPDMQTVQIMFDIYSRKVYKEGYLIMQHELTAHGKASHDPGWTNVYIELCGPILTVWDADADEGPNGVLPQYINISDAYVELPKEQANRASGPNHIFTINSAGTNRYQFMAADTETLRAWVAAIRLSCFECTRIHEIYSRRFITRELFAETLKKPINRTEGWIQTRLPGTTEWQKYWAVATDLREEKRMFGKKFVPGRGQLMFFDTKKAKRPTARIVSVTQAYMVYPETPRLIDMATLMKIEGDVFRTLPGGEQHLIRASASVLVMAPNTKELVRWLVGAFDTFKLYGRPADLLDDPKNISALNFGQAQYSSIHPRLFLELEDLPLEDIWTENPMEFKATFARALHQRIVPAHYRNAMVNRTNSLPLVSGFSGQPGPEVRRRTLSSTQLSQSPAGYVPPPNTASSIYLSTSVNRSRATTLGTVQQQPNLQTIYASDESGEEEDEDEEQEEDGEDEEENGKEKERTQSNHHGSTPVYNDKSAQSTTNATSSLASLGASVQNNEPSQTASDNTRRLSSAVSVSLYPPITKVSSVEKTANERPFITLPEITHSTDFASSFFSGIQEKLDSPMKPGPVSSLLSSSVSATSSSSTPTMSHSQKPFTQSETTAAPTTTATAAPATTSATPAAAERETVSSATMSSTHLSSTAWSRAPVDATYPPNKTDTNRGSPSPVDSGVSNVERENQYISSQESIPQQQFVPVERRKPSGYQNEYKRRSAGTLLQHQWEEEQSDGSYSGNAGYSNSVHGYPTFNSIPYDPQPMNFGYESQHQEYSEDGPEIPQLGEHFAKRNSLLDMYRSDQLPARVQEDKARATGQPFVHLPEKPPEPRGGLVGKISEIEHEKKEISKAKFFEIEKERALDRERERYNSEQRRSQIFAQSPQTAQSPVPLTAHSGTNSQPALSPQQQPLLASPFGMMNMNMGMMDPRMSMMPTMMDPRMSFMMPSMAAMPTMSDMNGMPAMTTMPAMTAMPAMSPMAAMPMMQPMMDPRMMPMMYMMQPNFGAFPMFQQPMMTPQQQAAMWNNFTMMHGDNKYQEEEEEEDEDDDVPLGAPQPVQSASTSFTPRPASSMPGFRQQHRHSGHF